MANYVSFSALDMPFDIDGLDPTPSFSDLRIFVDSFETSSNGSESEHPSLGSGYAPRAPLGEITNIAKAAHDDEQPVSRKATSFRSASRLNEQETHEQYRLDMVKGMMRQERARPRPDPFYEQRRINPWMRTRLIDWLVDVQFKFNYHQTTLFLTVSLVDRYLSQTQVQPHELQLIGVASMLIAAKFEECPEVSEPPSLAELVYITDGAYTENDIVDKELAILATLNFEVACPTAAHFLLHFCDVAPVSAPALAEEAAPAPLDAAWFALELALLDTRMLGRAPSELASAAILLGRRIAGQRPEWPVSCAIASGYGAESQELCVSELLELIEVAPRQPYQAVCRKYCQVHIRQRNGETTL